MEAHKMPPTTDPTVIEVIVPDDVGVVEVLTPPPGPAILEIEVPGAPGPKGDTGDPGSAGGIDLTRAHYIEFVSTLNHVQQDIDLGGVYEAGYTQVYINGLRQSPLSGYLEIGTTVRLPANLMIEVGDTIMIQYVPHQTVTGGGGGGGDTGIILGALAFAALPDPTTTPVGTRAIVSDLFFTDFGRELGPGADGGFHELPVWNNGTNWVIG
jgi:hypothetical protein